MKRAMTLFLGMIASAACWGGAVPSQITYQGTIKERGVPVTGDRDMQFRITDNAQVPTAYWTGPVTPVSVTQGLFSVPLTPTGVPWQDVTPYIELSVGPVGGTLQVMLPREPITATAYSLISGTVIDASITTPKLADGSITNSKIASGAITNANLDPGVQAGMMPPGAIMAYAGTSAPNGWFLCDGSPKSRAGYPALFAVIGVAHGIGDGSTTFNLPDYRGRFLRGQDQATGRDSDAASRGAMNAGGNVGDAVGSLEGGATQMPGNPFVTTVSGAHTHQYHRPQLAWGSQAGSNGVPWVIAAGEFAQTGNPEKTPDGAHSHGIVGGDSETRPANAAVNYIIKY